MITKFIIRLNYEREFLRKILITLSLLFIFGCQEKEIFKEVTSVFSMEEISKVGIKMKGDFETSFPEATHAKWGFLKGREVAIIRYETIEAAKELGQLAGEEQTEILAVKERNIAHGPKVERIECRGHAGYGVHGNCASRREPMYTQFIIHGNLVIMGEPLATEEPSDTISFLRATASKLQ